MRGRYPRREACSVIEYAPEMVACDAMTVAAVARPISGNTNQSGASR